MSEQGAVQSTGGRKFAAPSVQGFLNALTRGAEHWEEAGRILVSLRNDDEKIFDKLINAHSFLTQEMLEVFYLIGTGSLHPLSALLPRHVFSEVRRLGMSLEAQSQFSREMVQVVTHIDRGVAVTKMKPISKLTSREAKYALCRKGNATVAKQVAKIKEMERVVEPPVKTAERPVVAQREPKAIGQWAVRRTLAGYVFEKTNAMHSGAQRVTLLEGCALIQLVEYK